MANEEWDIVIQPESNWMDFNLSELWKCKDLIKLFVKRDFVTFYKQTVLGPLWYVIQPLSTTVVFTIIFGKIAKIPTDQIPPFLFYMSGTVVWSFFSTGLMKTSATFITNSSLFGKVYFPRLTVPISTVMISFVQFAIQLLLFLGFYFYFFYKGAPTRLTYWILALPFILLQLSLLVLGVGIFISSITTKYKDLQHAMGFLVQLWMYASPVVYPLTQVPEKYRLIYVVNPMATIVESFRYAFLGAGTVTPVYLTISWAVTLLFFFIGVMMFSRVEKTFMDTI